MREIEIFSAYHANASGKTPARWRHLACDSALHKAWRSVYHVSVLYTRCAAWQTQHVLSVKIDEDTIRLSLLKAKHRKDHNADFELGGFP